MPSYKKSINGTTIAIIAASAVAVGAIAFAVWSRSSANTEAEVTEETLATDVNGNERYSNTFCFEFGHETRGPDYLINAHDVEYFAYEGVSYVLCEIEFTNLSEEAVDFDPSQSLRLYLDNEQAQSISPSVVEDVLEPHLYLDDCLIQPGRRETGFLVWSYYKDFEIVEVCYNEYISFTGEKEDATRLEVPLNMIYDESGNLIDATTAEREFMIQNGSNIYHYCAPEGTNQCALRISEGEFTTTLVTATPEQLHDWGYTPCPECLPELAQFVIVPEPVETEPTPVPDPVWVPLLDEDGNPVYEVDEDGEPILDEDGNPIPVMVQQ